MSKKPSKTLAAAFDGFISPFRFDGSGTFHLKSVKTNEKGGLDKDEAEKIKKELEEQGAAVELK